jgi:hypothetical protein
MDDNCGNCTYLAGHPNGLLVCRYNAPVLNAKIKYPVFHNTYVFRKACEFYKSENEVKNEQNK